MCHSPLQHGLRQVTHKNLWLGSWSTVSYLFRDRSAQGQVPGYPPPADVPGGHSSPGNCCFRMWNNVMEGVRIFSLVFSLIAITNATLQQGVWILVRRWRVTVPPPPLWTWCIFCKLTKNVAITRLFEFRPDKCKIQKISIYRILHKGEKGHKINR
jgi:hypothetical protein